ncbi:protein translocase subunit SecD [Clostridium thermarum]|uniref:protein translocase subunit SecD n=1 Tax=Clostridium thermarum TaxID=1716543 RepID=UPI0013D7E8F5|nr:protein translocase subunit SecD [Clostridium thermarum]
MRTKKRTKATSIVTFTIVVLLIGLFAGLGIYGTPDVGGYKVQSFGEVLQRGLDLQGGVSMLLEVTSEVDDDTIDRAIQTLEMRVNSMGVSETPIVREGENRIRVEIPGKFNSSEIATMLSQSGKLTFVGPDGVEILTGEDVETAEPVINTVTNEPQVSLKFKESGKEKFAEATEKYYGQAITIKMDDETVSAPTVQAIITDGEATITNMSSFDEAKRVAGIIKSGALPVALKNVETKTVGPTLGEEAIPLSLKAGLIGIILVFLFMIVYYRLPGVIASLALIVYILLVLYAFKAFGVVLTLPGIAGFLLTIGMAVDANVLIFERIKEELKIGKSIKSSMESGFHRALSSIIDSNVTTIIAAVVLFYLGSGGVKGFALTLSIGIILSMFSAIVITKYLLQLAFNAGILSKPSYFGVKRG